MLTEGMTVTGDTIKLVSLGSAMIAVLEIMKQSTVNQGANDMELPVDFSRYHFKKVGI